VIVARSLFVNLVVGNRQQPAGEGRQSA
jgi:hypothetical protein